MIIFFCAIIGLITFVAFLHAYGQKEYDFSKTIVVNRPKAEVYAFIRQLKNQPKWIGWFQKDPNIDIKYRAEDGKMGAISYWKGNHKVGEGVQKITKIREGKVLETQTLFLKPHKTLSLCYMAVKEIDPQKTKMVFGIRGWHDFPASVLILINGMEETHGKEFEKGLQDLKSILEGK